MAANDEDADVLKAAKMLFSKRTALSADVSP
jgi:hypothetical protein